MIDKLKYILKGVLIGSLVGVVFSILIFAASTYLHGRLPGGTVVANLNLSYMTAEEAIETLKKNQQAYGNIGIEFIANGEKIKLTPGALGVEFKPEETIATLQRIDLKKSFLPYSLQANQMGTSKPLLFVLDQSKFKRVLNEKLELSAIAPQSAHFEIDKNKGLLIIPEKSGYAANYDKAIKDMEDSLSYLVPKKISVELTPQDPEVTSETLLAQKDALAARLRKQILLTHDNQKFYFKVTDHLDWIRFAQVVEIKLPNINFEATLDAKYLPASFKGAKKTIAVTLDDPLFNKYVEEQLLPKIEIAVDPVSIFKDESDKVVIKGYGRDGVKIRRENLKKALELAINDDIDELEIGTQTIQAPVTISSELQEMGIKELLGVGHTSYYNSPPNRIHNIATGVSKFNGILIPPDTEFSFNTNLGPVDDTTGYLKELVIKQDETIPEYGGGLCQVSTTAYRAAIFSGLPITARAPHSYAVSYYSQILGHGLDATIYLGGQDLKFKNDTPGYILMQAYVENMNAYFKFYGTSDGRKVTMEGPTISKHTSAPAEAIYAVSKNLEPGQIKQVEKRINGFNALWYRTITRPGQEPVKEEIFSRYKAMREKYLVAPGDARLPAQTASPAETPSSQADAPG